MRQQVGRLLGLGIAAFVGGLVSVLIWGGAIGILGLLVGIAIAFPTVKLLWFVPILRPDLRWLYPYASWIGTDGIEAAGVESKIAEHRDDGSRYFH